jgi:hypothetical protein
MAKYVITSNRIVCGHTPGSVVDDDDLRDGDVLHLLTSGHIAPHKATRVAKKPDLPDGTDSETPPEEL